MKVKDRQVVDLHGDKVVMTTLDGSHVNLQDRKTLMELKDIRDLTHENICTFVGICLELPYVYILVSHTDRGSLDNIIADDNVNLTWDFKLSLATDIATGMRYLHQSAIGTHGCLASSKCMVDRMWTCKITGHGLHTIHYKPRHHYRHSSVTLWTAPELLRMGSVAPVGGSKEGDVYSYGIVLQEIVLKDVPYAFNSEDCDTVLASVVKHANPPFRPVIPADTMSDKWQDLMTMCWAESPADRPSFTEVLKKLRKINNGSCWRKNRQTRAKF